MCKQLAGLHIAVWTCQKQIWRLQRLAISGQMAESAKPLVGGKKRERQSTGELSGVSFGVS